MDCVEASRRGNPLAGVDPTVKPDHGLCSLVVLLHNDGGNVTTLGGHPKVLTGEQVGMLDDQRLQSVLNLLQIVIDLWTPFLGVPVEGLDVVSVPPV